MSSAVCCNSRGCDVRLVQSVGERGHAFFERRTHEVVAVVDDQRNPRMILLIDHLRILRRNDHGAIDLSVAHVFPRLHFVVIGNRHKCARRCPHRIERFLDADGLGAMILVYDSHLRVANLSAKRVAQHDQLHQGKDHRHHHQGRGTEELAHLALDNCQRTIHGCIPGRCGMTNEYAFTSSSRNCRPV